MSPLLTALKECPLSENRTVCPDSAHSMRGSSGHTLKTCFEENFVHIQLTIGYVQESYTWFSTIVLASHYYAIVASLLRNRQMNTAHI